MVYAREEVGRVDVPAYIGEQEYGVTVLTPNAFNAATGRWAPFQPRTEEDYPGPEGAKEVFETTFLDSVKGGVDATTAVAEDSGLPFPLRATLDSSFEASSCGKTSSLRMFFF